MCSAIHVVKGISSHLIEGCQGSLHLLLVGVRHLVVGNAIDHLGAVVEPERQHARHRLVDVLVTIDQRQAKVLHYL